MEILAKKLEPSAIIYFFAANPTQQQKTRQRTGLTFCIGAAVELVERGYTIQQVMRKGEWKSAKVSLRFVMAKY